MAYHLKSTTEAAIRDTLGSAFELVSVSHFHAKNECRTRYTVKKPRGSKLYHLIGYANGEVRLAA